MNIQKRIEARRQEIAYKVRQLEIENYFIERDIHAIQESIRMAEFVRNWCEYHQ